VIVLVTVKRNVIKDLIAQLVGNDFDFEYNAAHHSFRVKNVTQWMLLTDKDAYLLSPSTIEIHKDNIEQICITDEDA